jgi:hypothetical protein
MKLAYFLKKIRRMIKVVKKINGDKYFDTERVPDNVMSASVLVYTLSVSIYRSFDFLSPNLTTHLI